MIVEGVDRYRVMEPLFECVRVVLARRGETYSPAQVQGISGAAFRIAGPCPCAPTCSWAMKTTDLVALLGYEFEHLTLNGKGIDPARDVHKIVPRVREEVRAGRAVCVWHAFTNAEWDVVCGFDEQKKQFLGRGSYAGADKLAAADETRTAKCLEICPSDGALLIGRKTGTFDAGAAELAALEEAVRHARSPRDRFLAEAADRELPWRFREGLACYDGWAQSFRVRPDRLPGAGDLYCLGVYRSTHRAAGEFMRELAAKYPKARAHLATAVECFTKEADALDELHKLPGMSWESPRKPDPKRNARAAELLAAAREAYAGGIDRIADALKVLAPRRLAAAARRAVIRKADGKAHILRVPELGWGRGRQCTFAGALEAATKHTEHPQTYADLMGLSGLAFRVRWANAQTKTRFCPSCAIGEMPDEQAAVTKLTGWRLKTDWLDAKGRDNDKLRERIVASIDVGRCVAAYGDTLNMAVIVGYENAGRTLLLQDYMKDDQQPSRLAIGKLGPMHTYLVEHTKPPALGDCLREALRTAVRNWRREKHDGGLAGREYWYGEAAFEAWIADLRGLDKLDPAAEGLMSGVDPWAYLALHDARKAAGQFLTDWARLLDPPRREALSKAAKAYEQEVKLLTGLLDAKRQACDSDDGAEKQASLKRLLQKEIEILTEARKLEGAAVEAMEKALE